MIGYLLASEVSLVPWAEHGLWTGLLSLVIGDKRETTQILPTDVSFVVVLARLLALITLELLLPK